MERVETRVKSAYDLKVGDEIGETVAGIVSIIKITSIKKVEGNFLSIDTDSDHMWLIQSFRRVLVYV